jgi:hypothetical protein
MGHVELVGGAAERAVAEGCEEVGELLQGQGRTLRSCWKERLPRRERAFYPGAMVSLIAALAILGANAALSLRYGADSRRDDGRRNW